MEINFTLGHGNDGSNGEVSVDVVDASWMTRILAGLPCTSITWHPVGMNGVGSKGKVDIGGGARAVVKTINEAGGRAGQVRVE